MPRTRLLTLMTARDPDEEQRAATPLELFFDLTFVVAIAQASTTMHHELVLRSIGFTDMPPAPAVRKLELVDVQLIPA